MLCSSPILTKLNSKNFNWILNILTTLPLTLICLTNSQQQKTIPAATAKVYIVLNLYLHITVSQVKYLGILWSTSRKSHSLNHNVRVSSFPIIKSDISSDMCQRSGQSLFDDECDDTWLAGLKILDSHWSECQGTVLWLASWDISLYWWPKACDHVTMDERWTWDQWDLDQAPWEVIRSSYATYL